MPRYDYECECGNIEEHVHSMKSSPIIKCGKCGKKMSKKIGIGLEPQVKGRPTFGTWYEKNFHRDVMEGTPEAMKVPRKELDKVRIDIVDNGGKK